MKIQSQKYGQRGTAAVELAIALPFLLFMMLGIGELGRAILQYNELTMATRDAARYLANHAISGSTDVIEIDLDLEKTAKYLVVYGNTATSLVPILPGLSTDNVTVVIVDSLHVRVDVAYNYLPLLGDVNMPMFGNGPTFNIAIPLRASAAMRAL